MLGKYLNGYDPKKDAPPQGWNEWDVAGNGYPEFNYDLNQNGKVVHHGKDPTDYLTDVLAGIADGFIRKSASGPFFIEIATFAPHAPYTPAPRDADKFAGLGVPRTPAYGARPDANAPRWLKDIPGLRQNEMASIDQDYRKRAEAVQAVDKMINEIRATLVSLGIADKTYVVFSSDNGYHMGDYSLRPGKMTPFDTDINVPLVIVGPGVARGQVRTEIVENVDLCPTFTDLGGGQGPTKVDGHSLASLLFGGSSDALWRQSALIEHHRPNNFDMADPDAPIPNSSNPITYEALRTANALYVEYEDGETSLYDLTKDPYELKNIAGSTSEADVQKFRSALAANRDCHGATACWKAQRLHP
jgi:arylsulfatase A-like enzyme